MTMTPVFVCSRYNGPIHERRLNLIEHDAMCRLAIALGYAPVSPFAGVDRDDPPDDAKGGREEALARSGRLAEMVGRDGGALMMMTHHRPSDGMVADFRAWSRSSAQHLCVSPGVHELLPYVPATYRRAVEMRAAGDPRWVREFAEARTGEEVQL